MIIILKYYNSLLHKEFMQEISTIEKAKNRAKWLLGRNDILYAKVYTIQNNIRRELSIW
jgi:hypothetical protein